MSARPRGLVARVLSLDHDARGFVQIGERDPVMAQLLAAAPGLRPPLFYSPYEAAIWAVLSGRRPARQMAQVRASHATLSLLLGQRGRDVVRGLPPCPLSLRLRDGLAGVYCGRASVGDP